MPIEMSWQKGDFLGRLILLDGTSSAGKTGICRQLILNSGMAGEYIAMDHFITEVFEAYKQKLISDKELVFYCNAQVTKMYEIVKNRVWGGSQVICDTTLTCLEDTTKLTQWFNLLKDVSGLLILVYCPIHVLAERVLVRNRKAIQSGDIENIRSAMVTLCQYGAMFKPQENPDEPIIDILSRHQLDYACDLIKSSVWGDIGKLTTLRENLYKHLGLFEHEAVRITPRLKYDFIVNAYKSNAQACAEDIMQNITHKWESGALLSNCRDMGLIGSFLLWYKLAHFVNYV
jgi:chloramphenicol 3-O-phosphotransferase